MKHSDAGKMPASSVSGTQAKADTVSSTKVRILIVDDSKTVAFVLRTYLTSGGYDLDVAESAVVAMRCVVQANPDIVIADVQMPGGSGFELIAALRKLPGLRATRYFLMSSTWTEERKRQARVLRVEVCLQKPVDPDELLDLIRLQHASSTASR